MAFQRRIIMTVKGISPYKIAILAVLSGSDEIQMDFDARKHERKTNNIWIGSISVWLIRISFRIYAFHMFM